MRKVRIFLSSPSDVCHERGLAHLVLTRLQSERRYRQLVSLEPVASDGPGRDVPFLADETPQISVNQALGEPSQCHIVVIILWSRMGTPLPPEFRKADGTGYLSGTEWEYENAVHAETRPDILVYRREAAPDVNLDDPDFDEKRAQYERVKQFFETFGRPGGPISGGVNLYETPADFERKFEQHLRELIERRLESLGEAAERSNETAGASDADADGEGWQGAPYPGLRAFMEEEAPVFFGREQETNELVASLRRHQFLAVIGASGSGKSSLVAAGLMPRLKAGVIAGSQDWPWVRFKPGELGNDPYLALASPLARAFPAAGWSARHLADDLRTGRMSTESLAEHALSGHPSTACLILFVDQFEELFTLVSNDLKEPFVEFLVAAAYTERLRVIVTVRADSFSECTRWEAFAELLRHGAFPLAPPGPLALADMIKRPAQAAGLEFEEGLVEKILQDTGSEPGALALMEFALSKLYEQRDVDLRRLEEKTYVRIGGVAGAIDTRAEEAVLDANQAVEQDALEVLFPTLVAVGPDGTVLRRRPRLASIPDRAQELTQRLIESRLLVATDDEGDPVVEVAHEALLRHWNRLREWIEKHRDYLIWRQGFSLFASDWESHARVPGYLLPAGQLEEAERRTSHGVGDLSELERDFLQESLAERARQVARDKRRRTLYASIIIAVSLGAAYFGGGAIFARWISSAPSEAERLELASAAAERKTALWRWVIRFDPDQASASGALRILAARYQEATNASLDDGNIEGALQFLRLAEATDLNGSDLDATRLRLSQFQEFQRVLAKAKQSLDGGIEFSDQEFDNFVQLASSLRTRRGSLLINRELATLRDQYEKRGEEARVAGQIATAEQYLRRKGQLTGPRSRPANSSLLLGVWRIPVLQVDFSDQPAKTVGSFTTESVLMGAPNQPGSLRGYLREISYEKFDLISVQANTGSEAWIRAPEEKRYYTNDNSGLGVYPRNIQKLAEDAIEAAAPRLDFSEFDNDGDGQVEMVLIVASGISGEISGNKDDFWSSGWRINPREVDGVSVSSFSLVSADTKIGPMASLLIRRLSGLPFLYPSDLSSFGAGEWGLLAFGAWISKSEKPVHPLGWTKIELGWLTPKLITGTEMEIVLPPLSRSPTVYKVPIGDSAGNEYFLLSNRQRLGFDEGLPGQGLVIEHIDESQREQGQSAQHLVDIVQCDGRQNLQKRVNRGDASDPFPCERNAEFTTDTIPSSQSHDGKDSGIAIADIRVVERDVYSRVRRGQPAIAK